MTNVNTQTRPASKAETLRNLLHKHLDVCKRCRNNPMDLCPLGNGLLRAAGEASAEEIAAVLVRR